MSQMFDVFLACAQKDFHKLPYVVESIAQNIIGYDNVIICSPVQIPTDILERVPLMHYTFMDCDSLSLSDRNGWKWRPNWTFQQHLKLFQELTQDWYLTLDCDTIVNKPMRVFEEDDTPICWLGTEQLSPPYFEFQRQMIGIDRPAGHTFIADMNLFHRPIINEMLETNGYTRASFLAKSQEISSAACHLGEPELYGNYWTINHPDYYVKKPLHQAPFTGYYQNRIDDILWTDDQIKAKIEVMKNTEYNTFSMHSWFNEPVA